MGREKWKAALKAYLWLLTGSNVMLVGMWLPLDAPVIVATRYDLLLLAQPILYVGNALVVAVVLAWSTRQGRW